MQKIILSVILVLLAACGNTPEMELELSQQNHPDSTVALLNTDPNLWMEEVEGERALNWVRAQNERSIDLLEAHPAYSGYEAAALDILNADERIPYGNLRGGLVYNFWQDETNVRGLWRRTTPESYATSAPDWEVLLDLDKLAADEGKNWVYKGAECFAPHGTTAYKCLISLSDGGKDAVVVREFDIEAKTFVSDGFQTMEAKQSVSWLDENTTLIATDWGDGSVTESGYPFVVKRWTRGTPIEAAVEIQRGETADVGVWPMVLEMPDGVRIGGAVRAETFFTSSYYLFAESGENLLQLPLPPKSTIQDTFDGKLLVTLEQDWTFNAAETYQTGDLIAVGIEPFLQHGGPLKLQLVFRPDESQAVSAVSTSKDAAFLAITENVVGKVLRLSFDADTSTWTTAPIVLPGTGQASILFASKTEDAVYLGYEGFLTPDSLLQYDSASGRISTLKSLPPKFDTTGLVVDQNFAVSKDGTTIPYFIVRKADIELNGQMPTLLYGYGGFQVSLTPGYSPVSGRLWLEQGGAYVVANIRGGGEFGPSWHQAGLKSNRQRVYDDFIAVAEDLVARKITSPDHLGIMGGSNGGLLMGVMLNQRPDLWNAVVVQVPLLDMLRYHTLLAGASWVDEYGSPENVEERAFLETISPYHNFDPDKTYPTPFFVTSTKDDRVHPGHARKMAKLFEDADKPFLYFENMDGGHSAAANQTARAKRTALEFTYLTKQLGLKVSETRE
ncbi:MAG: prolyl oligopeptidase family serine peptidase [Hyphomonas sp.]